MMRDVRSTLKGLLAAVLVAAAGSLTVASTFLKEDVESLGRKAESVVHARVSGVRSYWNDAHTMIFTDVTLQVKTLLHGRAALPQLENRAGSGVALHATRYEVGENNEGHSNRLAVWCARHSRQFVHRNADAQSTSGGR